MSYFSWLSYFTSDTSSVRKVVEANNQNLFHIPHWKVLAQHASPEDQFPSAASSASSSSSSSSAPSSSKIVFKRDDNKSPTKSRESEKRNSDSERESSSDDEEIKLAIKLSLEEDEKSKQRTLEMQKLDQLERSRYENSLRGSHFEDSYSSTRAMNIQRRNKPQPPPAQLAVPNLSTSPTKRLEFQRQFVEGIKDDSEEEHLVRHRKNKGCSATQQNNEQPKKEVATRPLQAEKPKSSTTTIRGELPPNQWIH